MSWALNYCFLWGPSCALDHYKREPSSLIFSIKFCNQASHLTISQALKCKQVISSSIQAFKHSRSNSSRRSISSHWRIQALWSPLVEDFSIHIHSSFFLFQDPFKIGVEDLNLIDLRQPTFIWSIHTCGFKDLNPPQGFQHKHSELFYLLCLLLQVQFYFKVNLKTGGWPRKTPHPNNKTIFLVGAGAE